ncbi:MAG: hypothetical protein KF862_03780 [Chitinophagaceae bacterium]|nr:hypothetical protein [Chitinophagaceae bacterium]
MTIFKTYTGNAMLNNALMTIEALAKLKSVSEISPSLLKDIYDKIDLKEINKRLKSYTMLFTKNGPLHNDKTNGDKIYESLFNTIISNFESEGSRICEISGLKFKASFSELYELALKKVGLSDKEIKSKDTNISRTWFPLIGGLGSDAQALPQAKFTVQIHPICIPILQFLPLSALLYKGGILLVDSSNFELTRGMVADNTKILAEKIQAVSVKDPIENVRDFAKGDYLIKVLNILTEKEDFEEKYSDLNMWSFSNSGTGASCEIDRVPNSLIRKLQRLYKNSKIGNELKGILSRNESAYSFIESLEGNKDWFLLYPNVFGSGKKKVEYDGVSPEFLEAYYTEIDKSKFIPNAKYIAGLIEKYKSKAFEKILTKTDAWNDSEYRVELFIVLVKATENNEWGLEHQIFILDSKSELPIRNSYYQLHKLVHFFTQKKIYNNELPKVEVLKTKVYNACKWIISLIQTDTKINTIKSNLTNPNEYTKVGFTRIILDTLGEFEIELENVIEIFYDEDFNFRKFGLNELLRIFFSQPEQEEFEFTSWKSELKDDRLIQNWVAGIQSFVNDYQAYYYTKYQNPNSDEPPYNKFNGTVNSIIKENDDFYSLLSEMVYNTNQFVKDNEQIKDDKWTIEGLLSNPLGNNTWNICVLTIKFLLKQTAIQPLKEKLLITAN